MIVKKLVNFLASVIFSFKVPCKVNEMNQDIAFILVFHAPQNFCNVEANRFIILEKKTCV